MIIKLELGVRERQPRGVQAPEMSHRIWLGFEYVGSWWDRRATTLRQQSIGAGDSHSWTAGIHSDNETMKISMASPLLSQRGVTLLVQVKTAKTSVLSMDCMYAGHATQDTMIYHNKY